MTGDHVTPRGATAGQRRPRVLPVAVGTIVALLVAWLLVCTGVLLHPEVSEDPQPADAVFVLGPSDTARAAQAQRFMDEGLAPTVVYATPQGNDAAGPGTATAQIDQAHCPEHHDYEVICFAPDPSTTQGEAIRMRDLAAERGWDEIIVITTRPHIARAQVIVERCYPGRTQWAPIDYVDSYWRHPASTLHAYMYQTAGFLKAWVTPGCETQLPGQPKAV